MESKQIRPAFLAELMPHLDVLDVLVRVMFQDCPGANIVEFALEVWAVGHDARGAVREEGRGEKGDGGLVWTWVPR